MSTPLPILVPSIVNACKNRNWHYFAQDIQNTYPENYAMEMVELAEVAYKYLVKNGMCKGIEDTESRRISSTVFIDVCLKK